MTRCKRKSDYNFKGRKITAPVSQIAASGFLRTRTLDTFINFYRLQLSSSGIWRKGQTPVLLVFWDIHSGQVLCCVLPMLDYLKFKPTLTTWEENLLPNYTICLWWLSSGCSQYSNLIPTLKISVLCTSGFPVYFNSSGFT